MLHLPQPQGRREGAGTQSKPAAPKRGGGRRSFGGAHLGGGFIWMGLESGQLENPPRMVSKGRWKCDSLGFLISSKCVSFVLLFAHVCFCFISHPLTMALGLLSPQKGRGAGCAIPFPWFCPCFQRAFKTWTTSEALGGEVSAALGQRNMLFPGAGSREASCPRLPLLPALDVTISGSGRSFQKG